MYKEKIMTNSAAYMDNCGCGVVFVALVAILLALGLHSVGATAFAWYFVVVAVLAILVGVLKALLPVLFREG